MRPFAMIGLLAVLLPADAAVAADIFLGGGLDRVRLLINDGGSAPKLQYTARSKALASGSVDDPVVHGAAMVVFGATDCACFVLGAAPDTVPGWRRASTGYSWRESASGSRARVKSIRLKLTRYGGPPYGLDTTPQGEVEVQLAFGTSADRFCTRFAAPGDARDDSATRYDADEAAAMGTPCSPVPAFCGPCAPPVVTTTTTSTSTSTSTTTTLAPCGVATGPSCAGACNAGFRCTFTGELGGTSTCGCFPIGQTTCLESGFPACGGACLNGGVCQAFRQVFEGEGQSVNCACVPPSSQCMESGNPNVPCSPGVCPNDLVCTTVVTFFPETSVTCGCAP